MNYSTECEEHTTRCQWHCTRAHQMNSRASPACDIPRYLRSQRRFTKKIQSSKRDGIRDETESAKNPQEKPKNENVTSFRSIVWKTYWRMKKPHRWKATSDFTPSLDLLAYFFLGCRLQRPGHQSYCATIPSLSNSFSLWYLKKHWEVKFARSRTGARKENGNSDAWKTEIQFRRWPGDGVGNKM